MRWLLALPILLCLGLAAGTMYQAWMCRAYSPRCIATIITWGCAPGYYVTGLRP